MTQHPADAAREVVDSFDIPGRLVGIEAFERGHIHDTFISTFEVNGEPRRFLHQHLNDRVFRDIPGLMHNISSVTRHLREKAGSDEITTLELVPTRSGEPFLDSRHGFWRTYVFVENTQSFDLCGSSEQAYEAAFAFGGFQSRLIDLDIGDLCETIPQFFSSPYRLQQFETALASAPEDRRVDAASEIEFAMARRDIVHAIDDRMGDGHFPLRVVHGDTKLNNVLFDPKGHAVCVVDLDTCMPGWSLYDFGDLVRFTAATSVEDETDLSKAGVDLEFYRALVDGYLASAGHFLTAAEVELMPFSARLVTFTVGLRFLTDHLDGDRYFKIHRPGHNLDRARVQFAMVAAMERQETQMRRPLRRSSLVT